MTFDFVRSYLPDKGGSNGGYSNMTRITWGRVRQYLAATVTGVFISLLVPYALAVPDCVQSSPPAPDCGGMYHCTCGDNTCGATQTGNYQYCCDQVTVTTCHHCFGVWECCDFQWVAKCFDFGVQANRRCDNSANGCVPL